MPGGENYGWHRMEALHCYNPPANCSDRSLTLPMVEYSHDDKSCSITGGYRYRGSFVRMQGIYFYADFCTGVISARRSMRTAHGPERRGHERRVVRRRSERRDR